MRPFYVFSLAQVPVFVSPWYLLLLAYFGWFSTREPSATSFLLLASCVTTSLLVHEFGHALTARRFGLGPSVMLAGFGGKCFHAPARRDRDDAMIVAAGPGAGLLLFAICLGTQIVLQQSNPQLLRERPVLAEALSIMVWINGVWNVFNLIPLWPMDGGQLLRLGVNRLAKPATARIIVHGLGLALTVLLALVAATVLQSIWMAMIVMFLGAANFEALRGAPVGTVRKNHKQKKVRLAQAFEAYDAEDYEETARICHQVRMDPECPPELLAKLWPLLGFATAHKGEPEEALHWLRRAEMSPPVAQMMVACLTRLGRHDEARALLDSPEVKALSTRVRQQLQDRVEYQG